MSGDTKKRSRAGLDALERKAAEVSGILRLLANEKRLLVLCHLAKAGELSVSELGSEISLSQSALSQHLAKLRSDELVTTRRDAQTIYYRIAEPHVAKLLGALYEIYCE